MSHLEKQLSYELSQKDRKIQLLEALLLQREQELVAAQDTISLLTHELEESKGFLQSLLNMKEA